MSNIIKKEHAQPATFGSVVDQIFQNNLGRFFDDNFWGFNGSSVRSEVPVNIRETDQSYELQLMAPGLKKEDFHLSVASDLLTVSFEHRDENTEGSENGTWLRQEYKQRSFKRTFTLDGTVDAGNIAARYEDGVLHLSLPKKEEAQKLSRTITVQ